MKVLISGATGLIGSALCRMFAVDGYEMVVLTRSSATLPDSLPTRDAVEWDPSQQRLDAASLEGFDAVVHLAGENIGDGRWTAAKKARIRDSRVGGTRLLCETLAELDVPPKTLVCASAIGYYGDRGDEEMTEDSPPGNSFLCNVCKEWEAAADPARNKGIRVVTMRTGVVLSPHGGALSKMLLPFKLGLGGVIGSGRQYMSWIGIEDAAGAFRHAMLHEPLSGPVNNVTPNPVTNREFTKTLGKVLRRPTIFPMPAFAARLAFGEMADELLLAGTRVLPNKLQAGGYEFRQPQLEACLRRLLDR